MNGSPAPARVLFLELAALGVDPKTGYVPELEISCSEIARLMRRVHESRQGLREILTNQAEADGDIEAIRKEGSV